MKASLASENRSWPSGKISPRPHATIRPSHSTPRRATKCSPQCPSTGNGSVRLAGRFTGDVTVDGIVSIEPGAKLSGGVRATSVTIAGELEGNVLQASRVDVLASGALLGDLKADTLTIAAGSRVRGHIDCGAVEATGKSKATASRLSASAAPSVELAAKNGAESVSSS